jgi:hypothetical protein
VPEIPDQPRQDQKRSDQQIAELLAEVQRLAALVRTVDLCGTGFVWTDRATGKQHMLHPADVAVILRADQGTEIEKIKESAYRAGREDLLRSGSCPECTAGDPHNEPDKPHIHLTAYGYLLYAPDHDQLDFVRQIREIERRAGYAEAVARLRDDERYRNWWTAHPDRQFGTAYWAPDGRQHLADYLETVGPDGPDVRTKPVDQSGVQPTEEQRAHE